MCPWPHAGLAHEDASATRKAGPWTPDMGGDTVTGARTRQPQETLRVLAKGPSMGWHDPYNLPTDTGGGARARLMGSVSNLEAAIP